MQKYNSMVVWYNAWISSDNMLYCGKMLDYTRENFTTPLTSVET